MWRNKKTPRLDKDGAQGYGEIQYPPTKAVKYHLRGCHGIGDPFQKGCRETLPPHRYVGVMPTSKMKLFHPSGRDPEAKENRPAGRLDNPAWDGYTEYRKGHCRQTVSPQKSLVE